MAFNDKRFLDSSGVSTLWSKIKSTFVTVANWETSIDVIDQTKLDKNTKATASALGLVKVDNESIQAATDGTISVKDVNVQKLFVASGDELIFNCGDSTHNI